MNEYVAAITVLTGVTWGGAEGIARVFKMLQGRKGQVALAFGPVAGVIAHAAGFLPSGEASTAWGPWVMAGFMGLVGSGLAGVVNDYVAKPLMGPAKK